MNKHPFGVLVTERTRLKETRLCVGLDPRLEYYRDISHLRSHTLEVLEATAPYAACVKPQLAFFEALGLAGFQLLEEVCKAAQTYELPIILDAKRGDIGTTAQAYATAWLSGLHAGSALTVNPFLGFETLQPFLQTAIQNQGAIFVLVKTSNPDQNDLQGDGMSEKIARHIADLNADSENEFGAVGAVVGATHPQDLKLFRQLMPKTILLLPGLGAQGAHASDLAPAFHKGVGALVNASRAIQYADGLSVLQSREAARTFQNELNAALR